MAGTMGTNNSLASKYGFGQQNQNSLIFSHIEFSGRQTPRDNPSHVVSIFFKPCRGFMGMVIGRMDGTIGGPWEVQENRSKLAQIKGPYFMKGACHAFYRNCGDGCYRGSCDAVWVENMDRNYSARGYTPGWSIRWGHWSWWCWCAWCSWCQESSKSLTSQSSPGQPGEGVEVYEHENWSKTDWESQHGFRDRAGDYLHS
jgi:hypothetical protein